MADLISDLSTYSLALESHLNDYKDQLGLQQIFFGDQDRVNTTPIACVEPDTKDSAYKGSMGLRSVQLQVYIIVYSAMIVSGQENRLMADQVGETIEKLLHNDIQFGGRVIDHQVTQITSGYVRKANSLVRASRLRVVANSQEMMRTQWNDPS